MLKKLRLVTGGEEQKKMNEQNKSINNSALYQPLNMVDYANNLANNLLKICATICAPINTNLEEKMRIPDNEIETYYEAKIADKDKTNEDVEDELNNSNLADILDCLPDDRREALKKQLIIEIIFNGWGK